jgi:hypothetical protein
MVITDRVLTDRVITDRVFTDLVIPDTVRAHQGWRLPGGLVWWWVRMDGWGWLWMVGVGLGATYAVRNCRALMPASMAATKVAAST